MAMPVLVGQAVPDGGAFRPIAEAPYGYLRQSQVPGSEALRPFRPALATSRGLVDGPAAAVPLAERSRCARSSGPIRPTRSGGDRQQAIVAR